MICMYFWVFFKVNYSSMVNRSITSENTEICHRQFEFCSIDFKVIPGPEADALMKTWVDERESER